MDEKIPRKTEPGTGGNHEGPELPPPASGLGMEPRSGLRECSGLPGADRVTARGCVCRAGARG